jgi:hypothetical protein
MAHTHFTEPTTECWQTIEDRDTIVPEAPWYVTQIFLAYPVYQRSHRLHFHYNRAKLN